MQYICINSAYIRILTYIIHRYTAAVKRKESRQNGGLAYLNIISSRRGPLETILMGHAICSSKKAT